MIHHYALDSSFFQKLVTRLCPDPAKKSSPWPSRLSFVLQYKSFPVCGDAYSLPHCQQTPGGYIVLWFPSSKLGFYEAFDFASNRTDAKLEKVLAFIY